MAKLTGTAPNQVPTNADLGRLAYQDKVVGSGATDPSSGEVGDLFYNTGENVLKFYTGSEWIEIESGIIAPSVIKSQSFLWLEPDGIQGTGSSVTGWNDSSGNSRHFTKGTAPSSNDGSVYKITFANGYDGCSAQPNTSSTGNYGGYLAYNGGNGASGWSYNQSFSCVMAINHTANGGGTSYNDGWGVLNASGTSSADGSWSVGPQRSHTWGGGYAEVPTSGTQPNSVYGLSIWGFDYDGSTWNCRRYQNGSWTTTLTGSGTFPNLNYDYHSVLFFIEGGNSSHYARGVLGEYVWWNNKVLTTTEFNECGAYLSDKYGIT